jgi:serine/threonine protein kinase
MQSASTEFEDQYLPPFDPRDPVKTTSTLRRSRSNNRLNHYVRGLKVGKGKYGDVYICRDLNPGMRGYTMVRPLFSLSTISSDIMHLQAIKGVRKVNVQRDKIKMLRKINQQDASTRDQANPLPNSTMNSIRKEIAIMKKCRHAHLVRLLEIIDDPNAEKIYMS